MYKNRKLNSPRIKLYVKNNFTFLSKHDNVQDLGVYVYSVIFRSKSFYCICNWLYGIPRIIITAIFLQL